MSNFENIQVGDKVLRWADIGSGTEERSFLVATVVTRTTKAQFEAGGLKFWKKNGRKVGAPMFYRCHPYDPANDKTNKARDYRRLVNSRIELWSKLDEIKACVNEMDQESVNDLLRKLGEPN